MAWLFVLVAALLVLIVGTACAIVHWWGIAPWQRDQLHHPLAARLSRKLSKAEYEALRVKCEGCGAMYHPDWGRYCPDCTGAD